KRELNLSAILGKSAEAKERRLVPEVVEDFFLQAAPITGIYPKEMQKDKHVFRVGRIPRTLWPVGERLEGRFGKLGREYKQVAFDKRFLTDDPTLEWVTPGHSLFECVRENVWERVQNDLSRGTLFYDINRIEPARLDVFSAAIRDGRGNVLHRRLFIVETGMTGAMTVRQPTLFLDLVSASLSDAPRIPENVNLPELDRVEHILVEGALRPFLGEIAGQREKEIATIASHVEISLNALIDRQNLHMAELLEQQQKGDATPLLAANIKTTEDRLDELNGRLERRREELKQERHCTIADIRHHGRAWVLPHPERTSPGIAPMVRDEEIERLAIRAVIAYEETRGWQVESVEKENRGFDLISRKPHPEDPRTAIEVRFIEVKGRAAIGEIGLTSNEYKAAERLKNDYWLYTVFNCGTQPKVLVVQNPARLGWEPIVKIEHYVVSAQRFLEAAGNG
ncbi:MAG TPA: DUF3883 domain-containing protein, partial [Candidatus Angelobacter sp.]|nr:DUF3883 domain-containing protein [Candidatus Angelobacter sp.]